MIRTGCVFVAPVRAVGSHEGTKNARRKSVHKSKHPRLQILTSQEVLAGEKIDMPVQQNIHSFKQAPNAKSRKSGEAKLF